MKEPYQFKRRCIDGEFHFVSSKFKAKPSLNGKNYNETEAIKASKKEADRLLLLIREE